MPALSPARQALAAAIGARAAAAERLDRVRAGRHKSFSLIGRTQDAVEEAEKALATARDAESSRLAAELVGDDAPGGITVDEALAALEKAQLKHATAERARDTLTGQDGLAERDLRVAESRLRDAVGAVVASEGTIETMLAEYEAALDRVADLREILHLLPGRTQTQMNRSFITVRDGNGAALAAWRVALSALETDPTAALPDATILDSQPAARDAA